jgi:hypothetical protein
MGLPARPDDGRLTGEATYLAVHDFDSDGDLDIFLFPPVDEMADAPEAPTLLVQGAAGFEAQPWADLFAVWQPTLGDVDGDGDLDLVLAGALHWLRSDGAILTPMPLVGIGVERLFYIRELEGHDVDGDGHLDLFALASHPDNDPMYNQDYILWGDGTGSFSPDVHALPAEENGGSGFDAQWLDWDGDGQAEIYVANDQGFDYGPNRLWRPQDAVWENLAPGKSVDLAHSPMGIDAGDLNRDGVPDLYLSASGQNVLLLSQPDGTLIDATLSLGADPLAYSTGDEPMGWAGLWVDHDNDGALDLFTTQGDWWFSSEERTESPINLLRWAGEGFEEVGDSVGVFGTGSFRGAVVLDFNADGVQDFLVSTLFGRPLLFLSDGCTQNAWLEVRAPPGSVVQVSAGGQTWFDWLTTSSGFGATATPVAHFGLGDAARVDRVEVVLPGGEVQRRVGPFKARRTIRFGP